MKLLRIKRKSNIENRYSEKMGILSTQVTSIKKYFLFFPVKTLHRYRETYYGKVKSCTACDVAV